MNFNMYLKKFEERVIITGILSGCFGKKETVTAKECRLSRTTFGKILGKELQTKEICALDYYGLLKKSRGLYLLISQINDSTQGQVKDVGEISIVHFASIKIEKVAQLAPDLVSYFPAFKKRY